MLLVQEYLANHSFGDLAREHGVYASFSKSGHKWSLNYDQIESKEDDKLAQECRGLILSCEDGHSLKSQAIIVDGRLSYNDICPGITKVLACPFFRFFNFGSGAAANVEFPSFDTVIQIKYDGSLIIVYFDPFMDLWCAATRSSPDADIIMDNGLHTFRSLFEKAVIFKYGISFEEFCESSLIEDKTYCFELMTPYNRIVVEYLEEDIVILGVRDISTLKEEDPSRYFHDGEHSRILAEEFPFSKYEDIISYINTQEPSKMEGVVVRDGNFNRIKIKSAAYVLAHKMKDNISSSPRNCLEAILSEKDDDMLPFLPSDVANNLLKMKEKVKNAMREYDNQYQVLLNCANRVNKGDKKTFALMVTANSKMYWSSPFFQMFDGKASSMKDFISKNAKDGTWSNSFLDKILEISGV